MARCELKYNKRAISKVDSIIQTIIDNIRLDFKRLAVSGDKISGGLVISILISDFSDVLQGNVGLDKDLLSGLVVKHKKNVVFFILDDSKELAWSGGTGTIMTRNINTGQVVEIKAGEARKIRDEYERRLLDRKSVV